MNLRTTSLPWLVAAALFVATPASAQRASAGPASSAQKDAGTHFQRAVTLYSEADYRAALVEFKRAYEIAPNPAVLYNLGQTYYQLQDYANALTSFQKYLAEGGGPHKAEVESSINVLKTRVGKVEVTTSVPACEVMIDDDSMGKTPLSAPLPTGVGRRRVVVSCPGSAPQTRMVEVAAGETATVAFDLGKRDDGPSPATAARAKSSSVPMIVGWSATGVLAFGAIVTGVLALNAQNKLNDARDTFPQTRSELDSRASTTSSLALVTDIVGAAAIIAGGVSVYLTLTRSGSSEVKLQSSGRDVRLIGTF